MQGRRKTILDQQTGVVNEL